MFAVPKLAPKTLGQELSLILKVFFANNVSSMLKRNCSSSSSQISEVFGKRIVDFLARNVADLKMHGTWALKVTKMAILWIGMESPSGNKEFHHLLLEMGEPIRGTV